MEKIFDTVEETLAAITTGEIIPLSDGEWYEVLALRGKDRVSIWKDADGVFHGEYSEYFREERKYEYCFSCDEEHINFNDWGFDGQSAIEVAREVAGFFGYIEDRFTESPYLAAASFAEKLLLHANAAGERFVDLCHRHLPSVAIKEGDPIPREVLEAMHMHGLLKGVDPRDPCDFYTFMIM